MNTPAARTSLLPAILKHPLMILGLWVMPQTALLLLNLRVWHLASGEATVNQSIVAGWLGTAAVVLLLVGVGLWVVPRILKRPVGLPFCLLGLLLNIAYLWLFMMRFDQAWPSAVAAWMLPQTEVIFYQFALVMPALFYCGLRLACLDLPLRRGVDIGLSFGMFLVMPLVWYVLFHVVELLSHRFFRGSIEVGAIVFFAGSTVLVMMAFLRLLYFLYTWLSDKSWGQTAMTAVAGLLCPISGLLLNIVIPFPCDFQSVGVYVLAILNGVVLIVPLPRRAGLALLTGWARSALYLFTLYFFVVFLPFMPLSLLAMLVCGAGFLILTPTLLFIIHTRRLAADAAWLTSRFGRLPVLALLLVGFLTLPAVFTARAWLDRTALTSAMNIVFSPDLRQARVAFNARAVSHALNGLRDMKDGLYLPFLSDAYNQFVFNGMILPDDKVEILSRALCGQPAPLTHKSDRFSLFFAPRSISHWGGGANRALPPRNVTLQPPVIDTYVVSNGVGRSLMKLELVNTGPANSEFVGTMKLPDGVLVSGFWLDVAGKRKAGAIIEKKTALWVYHMIRDYTRRDPGLLVYESDNSLKLNIFPFAASETRTVWIAFMCPANLDASVLVNDTLVPLATGRLHDVGACLVPAAGAGLIPGGMLATLPGMERTPVVHFIVERTAATSPVMLPPAVGEAAALLGGRCRVTFANISSVDVNSQPVSPAEASVMVRAAVSSGLNVRGGFVPDRAMARLLLASAALPVSGQIAVPVFVVIPASDSVPVKTIDLKPFAGLTPDVPAYYLWATDHLERVSFDDGSRARVEVLERPKPVVVFRAAGGLTVIRPETASALIDLNGMSDGHVADASREMSLDVYNPASGRFEPLPQALPRLADALYATGLRLLLDSQIVQRNPSALDASLSMLVDRSRMGGILTPFTSYMVVENTAQAQTLVSKQKQALDAHHALDFEEQHSEQHLLSPEPGIIWLVPVFLWIIWRARRKTATAVKIQ